MRTPENILTDSIFLMAFAQDLMIQDLQRRMKAKGEGLRQRSKLNLKQMLSHLKAASHYADELKEENSLRPIPKTSGRTSRLGRMNQTSWPDWSFYGKTARYSRRSATTSSSTSVPQRETE